MQNAINKALKTWYPKDHPLHFNPLHPALGLAGECGELLDLYKKERFKNGVSWWDCVHCGKLGDSPLSDCIDYTPKILDELGDLWYYLRILVYQLDLPIATPLLQADKPDTIIILTFLNSNAAEVLEQLLPSDKIDIPLLSNVNYWFFMLLRELNFTLDQVTESNWQKLSAKGNNGWEQTRDTVPESRH